jgi:hypothetical protein
MTKATVLGRVWVYDNEPCQIECWEHEFEPTEGDRLSGAGWAHEHLYECYDADALRELFDLPKAGNFQVMFKGTISGFKSYGMDGYEYDEEFEVEEVKFEKVSEEYMKYMFEAEQESKREQP